MKKTYIITIAILIITLGGILLFNSHSIKSMDTTVPEGTDSIAPTDNFIPEPEPKIPRLTESEARIIANYSCIKGGGSLDSNKGMYNENSKTWWFDANLNSTKEGCNPACVVDEQSKLAEINWRCTGLIAPKTTTVQDILALFNKKYPQYVETISITITKEEGNYVRGQVNFVKGESGAIFLATKIKTEDLWKIVHEGNGSIPCTLSSYGFPQDMLNDCAQ